MKLCSNDCYPICDFCYYAIHEEWNDHTGHHVGGPVGCTLHFDQEHQKIADNCGYCNDFYCALQAKEDMKGAK